ncbi:L-2,4-diaminobutyric acid acetyltransferase [Vibrio nigripulchritudo SOn1]|uniref:L-2,4-diaminobutyric acid acetyltransferase n=1 Tax=Vibrio nigripulchritudo SOn1 TaxID=1238450 RepID=A0AAV2VZY8_9VIBR|nr:diaminobutyrate acetyltransferase [Vibrio nigripulchritudo]CCO50292.1 L-2,4-diaminobutyric acid acetyltransferase [Vibrio nigripulchritudo SOn1]
MIATAQQNAFSKRDKSPERDWQFSMPNAADGDDVYSLIANSPPLDVNSLYCNFLQSTHFRQTCLLARHEGELSGFVSGYRKPDDPNTLFVWQVAVSKTCRGRGLAYKMMERLIATQVKHGVTAIETTITKENQASWALFKKLDVVNGERGNVSTFLDENTHFKGKHDTEYLYRIPLNTPQ